MELLLTPIQPLVGGRSGIWSVKLPSVLLNASNVLIIINFTADTANHFPKSFKVSAILNTPQVYLKWKLV